MYCGFHEEGDKCPECSGVLGFRDVEGCCCHISPPCHACVNNPLACLKCGWTNEKEPESKIIAVGGGISQLEYKPRQLDKTKIDYRLKAHSSCSQIAEGVYPDGTTAEQVRAVVDGTFGGRFESFGDGRFKFIQYTD